MYKIIASFNALVIIVATAAVLTTSTADGHSHSTVKKNGSQPIDRYDEYALAKQNWMLNCQGCHKPGGEGLPESGMPTLVGQVSLFLTVEGGREYLTQVPGVTNNSIPDEELASLLNWLLYEFDSDGIPENFIPYSGEEISKLRGKPLGANATEMRAKLLQNINAPE